ncbi:MAG TPA: hypothetical protein VJN64_02920 [Terriglobales bacterium]|nr:hypothetical protein [Terriglobales bacterium]
MPAKRRADCVRFAIAQDQGALILMHFVLERDHAPVEWGTLEFDAAAQRWNVPTEDPVLQRQAECYLSIYLLRKPREFALTRS